MIQRVFPKIDLDELIKQKQRGLYSKNDFYRPISIAIQGNNYCSLGTCMGCGISAASKRNKADELPKRVILNLLKQAKTEGIFFYYTNFTGEITDDLDFFGKMLKENPKMEAYKINTNCQKFTSIKAAEKIFKKLKKMGWTKTKYVSPICILSSGMQQHKVPLKNIIYGMQAFERVFEPAEARLLISHYPTRVLYKDTLTELKKLYRETFGKELDPSIIKNDPITRDGRAKELPLTHFNPKRISEYILELNCFGHWHQKYVCPEIYVHRDYSIYTCPLFEPHKGLKIGDAKKDSLKTAIKNANSNPFIREIAKGGTKRIYKKLIKKFPELKEIKVTNRHEACKVLWEYFEK